MQRKIEKIFLVSEIIASEMAAVNCPLLRREYLSRPVIALRNSFNSLHLSKRDFSNAVASQWSITVNGDVLHIWTLLVTDNLFKYGERHHKQLLITVEAIALEKISLTEMQRVKTVS